MKLWEVDRVEVVRGGRKLSMWFTVYDWYLRPGAKCGGSVVGRKKPWKRKGHVLSGRK
jgi:hypothetical protein